jgi:hypothetical protein
MTVAVLGSTGTSARNAPDRHIVRIAGLRDLWASLAPASAQDRSRAAAVPLCPPHEHHLLPCDAAGCRCHDAPVPVLSA